jgi:signal transduction histidine kinase
LNKEASISKPIKPYRVEHFKVSRVPDVVQREQYAAEQGARVAQRLCALGEMMGGIAHDFRNILAIIGSSLTLVERYSSDPEKLRTFIGKAQDGVSRGTKLTAQLLIFAKDHDLGANMGNINECLKDLESFLKAGAGPEVRVVLQLAPDIPRCLIDQAQFNAAVLNLVLNARDALPKGGTVAISTERWVVNTVIVGSPLPGLYVRVQVKDNGQGMPPEVTRRVFDPFFTTKGERGTGLGLPQVSAFMRLINGHVSIASERGVGTTVSLFFPSMEADEGDPTSN